MKGASTNADGLTVLDRPNSYIGKVVPRPNLERLMQGRGLYVSDMELPRMGHVVFLRSPHAHAKIIGIDAVKARRIPDVIAIVTGKGLAAVITPWVGVLSHLKGLKSAPQHAIAIDRVCWQGEAVAAVVATSRAAAEDAAESVRVEYQELDAVTDMRTALDPETPVIHPSLGDNLAFERNLDAGAVDAAFANSDEVVEADFIFGRHTGVTLEPRAVVADWNIAEQRLTIYQGTQAPHMVQNIAALHLGLADSQVRVVCKDVGGSFGIKVHIYADEMATYALSKLLRRRRRRQDIVAGRLAVRLDAQGSVICQTSITEQGQGSESLTAQIVGSVLGVSMDRVRVIRRHRHDALWWRHLGLARRRHWRRGCAAGHEDPAQEHPRCCRGDPAIDTGRTRYRK
jgi:carbon-monoxide dehydrogenase large subunit